MENSRDSIRVKYGATEFETTGTPENVQARYDAFLELVKAVPLPPVVNTEIKPDPGHIQLTGAESVIRTDGEGTPQVPQEIMSRVFRVNNGVVSLLALPRGDNAVRDACLMLLYGFAVLQNTPNVTGVTLMEACRQSGVSVDRLDRVMDAQTEYVNSGGVRRGKRYSLNNPGQRRAAELVTALV
jgi:hypothetical protein